MMLFRIADTFTDSLARLTSDEQKLVKTTAFDLQTNPTSPGMSFHKLDQARDKNFWSVRVSRDIRIIVHKTDASLLLCYVDHHDKAYAWAERRRLEVHPTTGAAQLVEIRERVEEIVVRYKVERPEAPVRKKLAKGLEFRAVAIMACDDEVIPLLDRIEAIGDEGDLESTYNTERQLLYVACTRARDVLLITACEPESEFLSDMMY